ncbi:hypothetical protein [Natrinema soli]|uniref:Uncharacterized protein n=1 Tax=Natrinema soli TaxID=1930624 RepID=A0ABD5SG91_9EURY|nr:hypothetical protein [Natrinema soli]
MSGDDGTERCPKCGETDGELVDIESSDDFDHERFARRTRSGRIFSVLHCSMRSTTGGGSVVAPSLSSRDWPSSVNRESAS